MKSLVSAVKDYLQLRRGLGYKLIDYESALSDFLRFMRKNGAFSISTALALRWAVLPKDCHPTRWARRLTILRHFAEYRKADDPRTEIPAQKLLPYQPHRQPPYIYTVHEIEQLLAAAKELPSETGLRSHSHSTLLGLMVVTGMRISEPLALNCEDVDMKSGVLAIHQSKFGKSRLIPIHSSTCRALCRYADVRDAIHPKPKTSRFFVSEAGTQIYQDVARWTFVKLSRRIGLRGLSDSHGPRLLDFRHSFAVRTLVNWYRKGIDVERHLPTLATYLGHTHVSDTYWYLSATPELMQLAANRLDSKKKGALS